MDIEQTTRQLTAQRIAALFNRLAVINAELSAIEFICKSSEDEAVETILSITQKKQLPEPPAAMNGGEDMSPVIVVNNNGIPPMLPQMIADQINQRRQKQYEQQQYDYNLSDVITMRVMAVITNELKGEKHRIISELKKFNINADDF